MFGNGSGFIGSEGLFTLGGADNSPATGDAYMGAYKAIAWTGIPLYAKFFFQLVFAGTAATIVSGSVAERIKYLSFIVFSFLLVAFVYPITGHWIWGGGWLATGGLLGLRRFDRRAQRRRLGGARRHPRPGAAPGQVRPRRQGEPDSRSQHDLGRHRLLRAVARLVRVQSRIDDGRGPQRDRPHLHDHEHGRASWACSRPRRSTGLWDGKPDLGMSINGCLAGLVAITAPCAFVTVNASLIIGLLAGLLVVCAVKLLDKLKIDDPVGAVPVHLFNGVFGTICVGLFAVDKITGAATGNGLFNGGGMTLLIAQLKGIVAVAVYTLVVSLIFWFAIKAILGLRVSKEEEEEGLDIGEHGQVAYIGFGTTARGRSHLAESAAAEARTADGSRACAT